MKNKIINILTKTWALGSFVLLFGGGITVFGYVAALIIGGETGAAIIAFLYSKVFAVLIYVNSIFIVLGVIRMWLAGQKALTATGKSHPKYEGSDEQKAEG